MAAFRRRTHFAAPLIVTVAAGCSSGKAHHEPKHYPGRVWSVTMAPNGCRANEGDLDCPPGVSCNPPPPQAVQCPPGASGSSAVRIAERANKTCAVIPAGCVDEKCLSTATPCPLEYGKQLPVQLRAIMVVTLHDGACLADEKSPNCPPNVNCNPPEPRKVACPPGIAAEHPIDLAILPDKTCAVVPEGCSAVDCVGAKIECPE